MSEGFFYNALNIAVKSDYKRLHVLRKDFASWSDAWAHFGDGAKKNIDPDHEWKKLEAKEAKLVLIEDGEYPALLKETPWPPFGIYVRGVLPSREDITLAIVGTRKATDEGKEIAEEFAFSLSKRGIRIVSGLAFGIDAAAHRGALKARGITIAVLANGLDAFYPRSHEKLAREIIESGGAIVSEYPLGSPVLPYRFLERNRIVSGLSRGTLVVEAPKESGALTTVRFALEQNRDVFVVPGPARHPNFAGSHSLIKSGAQLVTDPEDIIQTIAPEFLPGRPLFEMSSGENDEEECVVNALREAKKPVSVDKIIELTNLKPKNVNQVLTFLVLKGAVKESDGGYTV